MPRGYISIILHAHLPYVRHPEHERFLEERWLFEAVVETYVPLLRMLERLEDDRVDYHLLLSLSPTLIAMLDDKLLQERCSAYLDSLLRLARSEVKRTTGDHALNRLARWYEDRFRDVIHWYEGEYDRRLVPAFGRLAARGRLELMTTAATHGFLPIIKDNPAAVRAQVHTAAEYFQQVFGLRPRGMWLPECAYYPGLEDVLKEAGVRYFVLDTAGLERAHPRPARGVYAPAYLPNGVAAFARDRETSHQVWAADVGYPGHADYREFYRDIGFDLEEDALGDFLLDGVGQRVRTNTGIKYYRITRDGERKELYDPDRARERAAEHAGDFMFNRELQVGHLAGNMDRPPLVVAPYDAELFGHWWYEGPLFLEFLLRKLCYDQDQVKTISPEGYLRRFAENEVVRPAGCSWGEHGTYEYWVNPANDGIVRDLHLAAHRLTSSVTRHGLQPGAPPAADSIAHRLLQQMARELMLAQASDWPFIMRTGTSPEYASRRVHTHLARMQALEEMLATGNVDQEILRALEYLDNIFPAIDPGWYTQ